MRSTPLCALVLATSLGAGAARAAVDYPQSVLSRFDLALAEGAQRLLQQDLGGDDRLDLLAVRALADGSRRLEVWERRDVVDRLHFTLPPTPPVAEDRYVLQVGNGLPPAALDAQGLYLPGGVAGAGRDLAVLVEGAAPNLRFFRNRGPGTSPRFSAGQVLDVPGARRFHYFPLIPFPPGDPGYVAFPLAISTDSGTIRVVEVGNDGTVELHAQTLEHPGGAHDVLIDNLGGQPRLISLGGAQVLLWTPGEPDYSPEPLDLPGYPVDGDAVHGVLGDFDGDYAYPDLVLAFADGRVLRWDGVAPAGATLAFGPAQAVASGLEVRQLLELSVGSDATSRSALLVVADPQSRLYPVRQGVAGQPFDAPQGLPAAAAAAGDIGLSLLALGRQSGGIGIYERNGTVDEQTPFSIGWKYAEPIPLADRLFTLDFTAVTPSPVDYQLRLQWRDGAAGMALPVTVTTDGVVVSPLLGFPAASRAESAFAALSNSPTQSPVLVELDASGSTAPLRAPLQRSAFLLPATCTEGDSYAGRIARCIATCFNSIEVPPELAPGGAVAKGVPRFFDAIGLQHLYDLRAQVFAGSRKGREYSALYADYSGAIQAALLRQPEAFLEYAAARDAWMPAIAALVAGEPYPLTAEMIDRLDAIAAHLRQFGDDDLRAVVEREYALLDPHSLVGGDVQDLRSRFESLPVREVFRDSFEATTPIR